MIFPLARHLGFGLISHPEKSALATYNAGYDKLGLGQWQYLVILLLIIMCAEWLTLVAAFYENHVCPRDYKGVGLMILSAI